MDSDSVAVHVAVAELSEKQKVPFRSFFQTTDDQKLPLNIRQRLDENGLQVAVVSSVNSERLQSLLAPIQMKPEWLSGQQRELAEAGKLPNVSRLKTHRHVEKKRGESFRVETSPVRPNASWCIHVGDRQLYDHATMAQGHMRVKAWPQVDGTVKLEFLPEVHHGQNLSRIGTNGNDLALRQRQEIKELHSLTFSVTVRVGETIVVAPTKDLERVGKLFFDAKNDLVVDNESNAAVALGSELDDGLANEYFPMLNEESLEDPAVQIQEDQIGDIELATENGPPNPWQRFLLIRVVDVTDPMNL